MAKRAIGGEARSRMVRICRGVVVRQMASRTNGGCTSVDPVEMALPARCPDMSACKLKDCLAVSKERGPPGSRRVATDAISRQARGMPRISRYIVLLLVARHALYRGTRILTVDVTLRADSGKMCTGQRKRRPVVIERRRTPGGGRMAPCTVRRETRTMLRIRRRIVLCYVT